MIVPVNFDRCSICLEPKPLTLEHIIPESIGGTLQAEIQCVDCNSNLGSELVSQARQDPVLRLAIRNLKNDLPDLYSSMEYGQKYIAKDVTGKTVITKFKGNRFEALAQKKNDGSIILDTRKGRKNIAAMLAKDGLTPPEIEEALNKFKQTPDNQKVMLSKSLGAVRWGIQSLFPAINKPEMNPRLVLLIAYNFLCLLVGDFIFDRHLDFIRAQIVNGDISDRIRIESFGSRKYDCYHRLSPEYMPDETRIKIVLFGWLIYVVHLHGIVCKCPDSAYAEDLKNKRGLLATSVKDAEQNVFYSTKPQINSGA
jgi:HNH endonuclease